MKNEAYDGFAGRHPVTGNIVDVFVVWSGGRLVGIEYSKNEMTCVRVRTLDALPRYVQDSAWQAWLVSTWAVGERGDYRPLGVVGDVLARLPPAQ